MWKRSLVGLFTLGCGLVAQPPAVSAAASFRICTTPKGGLADVAATVVDELGMQDNGSNFRIIGSGFCMNVFCSSKSKSMIIVSTAAMPQPIADRCKAVGNDPVPTEVNNPTAGKFYLIYNGSDYQSNPHLKAFVDRVQHWERRGPEMQRRGAMRRLIAIAPVLCLAPAGVSMANDLANDMKAMRLKLMDSCSEAILRAHPKWIPSAVRNECTCMVRPLVLRDLLKAAEHPSGPEAAMVRRMETQSFLDEIKKYFASLTELQKGFFSNTCPPE